MVTFKKIVYFIGNNNNRDVPVKTVASWFEGVQRHNHMTVYSLVRQFPAIFTRKKVKRDDGRTELIIKLSKTGMRYYEDLKIRYDPLTDSFIDLPTMNEKDKKFFHDLHKD